MAKRWQERYELYQKAVNQLEKGLATYPDLNELEKDGVIQRFEFTFELAWKTLQDYFAQAGGYTDVRGPRIVLKQATQDSLTDNGYTWLKMLESRNELTHVYDEEGSRRILDDVAVVYLPLLKELAQTISQKI